MDQSANPTGRHDWHSPNYVEQWVAGDLARPDQRTSMLRAAVELLPFDRTAALVMLDIGAGYGAFSAQLLETFPNARVVAQDFSEIMVAHARARLDPAGERTAFALSDLSAPGWADDLGGPFDAAVSSIAIHNLAEPARIRALYGEIAALLRPGGWFLNLDLIPAPTALAGAYNRGTEAPEPSAAGHVHSADHHGGPHGAHDQTAGLENQLRWLGEAGFADVDCVWKKERLALLVGIRTAPTIA